MRYDVISSDDISKKIATYVSEVNSDLVTDCIPKNAYQEMWEIDALEKEIERVYGIKIDLKSEVEKDGVTEKEILAFIEKSTAEIFRAKETLYGLHKLYGVSIEEILLANPDAKDGLTAGKELLIPKLDAVNDLAEKPVTETPKDTSKYLVHVVKQGETLYSIAQQYRIKGSELIDINGVRVLSIGDKVLIPKSIQSSYNLNDEVEPAIKNPINHMVKTGDSIVLHKVKKGETLYALSKQYHVTPDEIRKANDGLPGGLKRGMEIRIPIKVKVQLSQDADTASIDTLQSISRIDLDRLRYSGLDWYTFSQTRYQ